MLLLAPFGRSAAKNGRTIWNLIINFVKWDMMILFNDVKMKSRKKAKGKTVTFSGHPKEVFRAVCLVGVGTPI